MTVHQSDAMSAFRVSTIFPKKKDKKAEKKIQKKNLHPARTEGTETRQKPKERDDPAKEDSQTDEYRGRDL